MLSGLQNDNDIFIDDANDENSAEDKSENNDDDVIEVDDGQIEGAINDNLSKRQLLTLVNELEDRLLSCPIGRQIFLEPVLLEPECIHTLEKETAEQMMAKSQEYPPGKKITGLKVNYLLHGKIDDYLLANPQAINRQYKRKSPAVPTLVVHTPAGRAILNSNAEIRNSITSQYLNEFKTSRNVLSYLTEHADECANVFADEVFCSKITAEGLNNSNGNASSALFYLLRYKKGVEIYLGNTILQSKTTSRGFTEKFFDNYGQISALHLLIFYEEGVKLLLEKDELRAKITQEVLSDFWDNRGFPVVLYLTFNDDGLRLLAKLQDKITLPALTAFDKNTFLVLIKGSKILKNISALYNLAKYELGTPILKANVNLLAYLGREDINRLVAELGTTYSVVSWLCHYEEGAGIMSAIPDMPMGEGAVPVKFLDKISYASLGATVGNYGGLNTMSVADWFCNTATGKRLLVTSTELQAACKLYRIKQVINEFKWTTINLFKTYPDSVQKILDILDLPANHYCKSSEVFAEVELSAKASAANRTFSRANSTQSFFDMFLDENAADFRQMFGIAR